MKSFFSIILTTFYLSAFAQQHTITLDQSKKAALEHSYAIKNGNLKISSAEADVAAAKSDYLPSVAVNGAGLYGFKDFVGAYPPLLEQGINNFFLVSASGTEPIYAGGKIKIGNKLAALQLEVSKVIAKQSTDSVLLITEQKYWNIVNLQEQKKTLDANEIFLNGVLKQQQDMLASGLIARNDLLKVKVQLSRLLLNKSKLNNGRRLAVLDLCLYTGIPYDSLLVVKDTFNTQQLPVLPDVTPDTSLAQNYNYQLLVKNLEGEKLQTQLTRGNYLPSVAVGLNATEAGVIGRGIGSSFIPAALMTVKVPISDAWWGRGKQKLKQRTIIENMALNNLEDGKYRLKVGIMKNWYDMKDGLAEIAFAGDNLAEATENLKVNQDNYSSGLASITDLLDAQAAYQEAESNLTNAYANFESKEAAFQFITGRINEQ